MWSEIWQHTIKLSASTPGTSCLTSLVCVQNKVGKLDSVVEILNGVIQWSSGKRLAAKLRLIDVYIELLVRVLLEHGRCDWRGEVLREVATLR